MAVTASDSLRVLRIASVIEGATLLLLFLVAMPLKYVADTPLAVSIVGPIHGAAFLIYTALVLQSFVSRLISVTEVARLMAVAFIPLGAWLVAAMLRRPRTVPLVGKKSAAFLVKSASSPIDTCDSSY